MQKQFGSGVLFGKPVAGNEAANPTPYKFGILQEADVTIKGDTKKLYGQKQLPVAGARGKIEVSVKAKFAGLDPGLFNQLFLGQVATTGMHVMADDEAVAVPGVGPYTDIVAHGATFVEDFGVRKGSQQFERVAGAPAAGQYSVDEATGTYTFAAADANAAVKISYTWNSAAAGKTVTINNQLMGYAPEFKALLYNTFRGKYFAIELVDCIMDSMALPTKQEDFWVSDVMFTAFCDDNELLAKIYMDTN
jgi:hypothetical protein